MGRLLKYCIYSFAVLLPLILLQSCGSSNKTVVTKSTNDALPAHRMLSDEDRMTFTSTFFEANKEKMIGNYDKALALFFQCLNIDPANADANFQVGGILEYYKEPDSAMVYARRAALLEPSNTWYQELYAQCLDDKGRYKEEINVYRDLLKSHPANVDFNYKLAMGQIEDGQYENAASTYDSIEKQEGGFSEEITREKIKIYQKTKNYPKAEQEVERLIQHDSTQARYYDMLGDLYEIEGKSDKAFQLYKQMEVKYPDDPSIRLSLAHYYKEQHNDQKSLEELEAAFRLPAMDIDSKVRILYSFFQMSNGHDSLQMQSIELCKAMVQAHPNNPKAHSMYGDFLVRQGSYREARDQYKLTLSEDSSKYAIWGQVMSMDLQINDYADLLKTTNSAMVLFPERPEPYLFNGFANSQQKNYDAAVSSLSKGVDYVVNDNVMLTEFYATLGDIYNSLKRYHASDSAYDQALKINPANDNVLNNYSYFLSERDTELDKAEQMSKKANEISVNNYTYQDTYAWILYRDGKFSEAKEWEEKSIDNGGAKDATVLDHYGDILFKTGDKGKAVEYWQKAKDAGLKSPFIDKKISDKQLYDK